MLLISDDIYPKSYFYFLHIVLVYLLIFNLTKNKSIYKKFKVTIDLTGSNELNNMNNMIKK